jgi:DNA topoisomerase IA
MHIIASLTTAKSIEPMLEHEIRLRATTFMNAAEARRDMRSMIGFKLSTTYYVKEGLSASRCQANALLTDEQI